MATINITEKDIYKDMRQFLLGLFPDASSQIVQTAQSTAPLPIGAITMSFLFEEVLDTSVNNSDITTEKSSITHSKLGRFQLDFYGDKAAERSAVVNTVWRNGFTCEKLLVVQPAYVNSVTRAPYINDSNQYENRFIVDLSLLYNQVVTYDQETFVEGYEYNITPEI